jgi:Protein of unknown function (DUF4239)
LLIAFADIRAPCGLRAIVETDVTALLQLPDWLGSTIAIVTAVVFALVPFLTVRWFWAARVTDKTNQVAETVAVRIGALHALILALVFAEAQSTHAELRQEVSKEVTTLEHVVLHLNQWDGPEKDKLRSELAVYVRAILRNEWQAAAPLGGSHEAKHAYNALDLSLLNLPADTPRQQSLRTRMLMDMDTLQEHRRNRLSLFHRGLPGLFWWVALAGFAITVGLFFIFPINALHIAMLSMYGAYTGLVLYFILALSHPYIGPAAIDASAYATILDHELQPD